jgi:hypothetical protein
VARIPCVLGPSRDLLFIIHRVISRKLGELAINTSYLAAYNRARWVSYSGFTAFFILNTLSPFLR